jgi:hypothetical protein
MAAAGTAPPSSARPPTTIGPPGAGNGESMKTKAAVLRAVGQPFEITELELDEPKAGEVLIRYVAAGLCHSDEHLRHGDIVPRFPIVGGHEGGCSRATT